MGHLLTSEGIRPDPAEVQAITEMPKPKDMKAVQRFVGFVTYLAKFVPHLSETIEPLCRLTTKDAVWTWQSQQEDAFQKVANQITNQPVLKYYDVNKELTMQCDASDVGLGAALLQDGMPVVYASRALSQTEQRYAQIEKECLAIVFACERFDQYILGRDLVAVCSEHSTQEYFQEASQSRTQTTAKNVASSESLHPEGKVHKRKKRCTWPTLFREPICPLGSSIESSDHRLGYEQVNFTETLNISEPRLKQIQCHTTQDTCLQTLKSVILSWWPETKEEVPAAIRIGTFGTN